MKKAFRLFFQAGLLLSCFWAASCIDEEFDLGKDISTVISVGGDSLTVPLIDYGFINIEQLMDISGIDILDVDEENGYSLSIRDSQVIDGFVLDEVENFIFNYEEEGDPIEILYASQQNELDELQQYLLDKFGISVSFSSYKEEVVSLDSIVIDQENCWEIDTALNFPDAVLSIDSLTFDESELIVRVDLKGIPEFKGDMKIRISMGFPESLRVSGPNIAGKGSWICEKTIHPGDNSVSDTIRIQAISIEEQPTLGQLHLDEEFNCRIQATIKGAEVKVGDLENGCSITIVPYINLSHLALKGVYGLFNYTTEAFSMDFRPDWPQALLDGGFRASLAPYIKLQTRNNFGIPLNLEADITPKDGAGNVIGDVQSFLMDLPRSQSPFDFVQKNFYLCKDEKNQPEDYQYVQIDLGKLLDETPEVIAFDFNASTNTAQKHEYLTHSDYKAFMTYEIGSAIAFGKDAFIQYSDTITVFEAEDNSYLDYLNNGIKLLGEIKNTLPLNLDLTVQAIDADNKPLKIEAPVVHIPACLSDGSASVSNLDLRFSNEDNALSGFKGLIFSISLSGNEGIEYFPLKPSQGIELNHIGVMLEGGITIDLGALDSKE